MSNVVSLDDYRNGKRPERHTVNESAQGWTDKDLLSIRHLLGKSITARNSVSSLGTVYLREKAVVDSVKFMEQAFALAKSVGLEITQGEDKNGNTVYVVGRISQ